jgi:hypothetical protein
VQVPRTCLAGFDEPSRSAPSEARHEPEQAFYGSSDGQAHDDIACPMSEKDNTREHQTASNCPDGVTLGRRHLRGIPLSGKRVREPSSGPGEHGRRR